MNLTVAKFGGSTIGVNGEFIPDIIERIKILQQDGKVISVFSAPLTIHEDKRRSITDIVLNAGSQAEVGNKPDLGPAENAYAAILESWHSKECRDVVDQYLGMARAALDEARQKSSFADEVRARALAYAGELLMSHVMNYIMRDAGIRSTAVSLDMWPIVTDHNIESTNFLYSESAAKLEPVSGMLKEYDVISIGGFIGRTVDGTITTFERGGSDRTAADLGILFYKKFDTKIDFEKDSSVVSADPKIVSEGLDDVRQLSYNEARLAGMFGMKILDPIAIKEILENGADMPITVTNMKNLKHTVIIRNPSKQSGHPLKIVTGKKNCAIFRIESDKAVNLLESLDTDRRYGEFIILSPYTKDGLEFTRILFLDGDFVRRNEKYLLGFDPLATITYNRGVITLIGDQMWRVQQVASRASAKIGEAGLNILNMDAQEETSRIIIIVEDSGQNVEEAIRAIHEERPKIGFV